MRHRAIGIREGLGIDTRRDKEIRYHIIPLGERIAQTDLAIAVGLLRSVVAIEKKIQIPLYHVARIGILLRHTLPPGMRP